jgi:hypothetical protein
MSTPMEMDDLESAGHVKFDILGVAMLDKVHGVRDMLRTTERLIVLFGVVFLIAFIVMWSLFLTINYAPPKTYNHPVLFYIPNSKFMGSDPGQKLEEGTMYDFGIAETGPLILRYPEDFPPNVGWMDEKGVYHKGKKAWVSNEGS